jgi:hypothetical protein
MNDHQFVGEGEGAVHALARRLGKDIDALTDADIEREAGRLRAEAQAHFEHAAEIDEYVRLREAGLIR